MRKRLGSLLRRIADRLYYIAPPIPDGQTLFKQSREYPSVINNGYRHIEIAIELLKRHQLVAGNLIVDVGGATGIIAGRFAMEFPGNIIYSFEPLSSSFSELEKVAKSYPNIEIFKMGLGETEGSFEINVSDRISSSSLLPISNTIGDAYFAASLHSSRVEKVVVNKLDKVLSADQTIAMIKMDVQGFELNVLKGATETLKRTHFVLTEVMYHDFYVQAPAYHDIDSYLRSQNFSLLDIIPSIRRNNKLMEADVIYYNTKLVQV